MFQTISREHFTTFQNVKECSGIVGSIREHPRSMRNFPDNVVECSETMWTILCSFYMDGHFCTLEISRIVIRAVENILEHSKTFWYAVE